MPVSDLPFRADAKRFAKALSAAHDSFRAFKTYQTHVNVVLRATEVALHLAPDHLECLVLSGDDVLVTVGRGRRPLRSVLSQYKVIGKDRKPRPVTADQFKDHLDLARDHLYRSVLVFYLSAFERFLEGWTHAALMVMPDGKLARSINELAERVNAPNRSVTVPHIAKAFELDAGWLLRRTLPIGTKREAGTLGHFFESEGIYCFEITEMWRHLRNVIVHHDGRLAKMQEPRSRAIWRKIWEQRGPHQAASSDPFDQDRVKLLGHHVVHCFTHTHRTAEVLMQALAQLGQNPIDRAAPPSAS